MRSVLLIAFVWVATQSTHGQLAATTCTTGDFATAGSTALTYTLGQPMLGAFQNPDVVLNPSPLLFDPAIVTSHDAPGLVGGSVLVYPQPATSVLRLRAADGMEIGYSLFNGQGQLVASGTFTGSHGLEVQALPSGVYTLRLSTTRTQHTQRVLILH